MNTTHYSVVDGAGNAVSTTTTLNNSFGSAVLVTGAGFLLNDEMDDFADRAGKAEHVRTGAGRDQRDQAGQADAVGDDAKHRARSAGAGWRWWSGTPGGPTIITQVYHVISNVIDHAMSLPDAVAAPRHASPGAARPDRAEPRRLPARGDRFAQGDGAQVKFCGGGDVQAIIRTANGWQGVSDPRGGGAPSGY